MSFKKTIKDSIDKKLEDGVHVKVSIDIRKIENIFKKIWAKLFGRKK